MGWGHGGYSPDFGQRLHKITFRQTIYVCHWICLVSTEIILHLLAGY